MTETRRKTGRPCDWCDKALGSAYVTGDDGARYCSRECENARWTLLGAAPALLAACEKLVAVMEEGGMSIPAINAGRAAIAEAKP